MNWLVWREYRRNRWILALGAVTLLLPSLLVFLSDERDSVRRLAYFVAYCAFTPGTVALLAAHAMAGERADRSAEFIAYLPLPVRAWQQYGASEIKVSPEETYDGKTYLVLQAADNVKFFLDKQSHLLAGRTIAEADDVVLSFGNYTRHKGVQLPGTRDVEFPDEGGKTIFHFAYDKTEINVELDDAIFDKP